MAMSAAVDGFRLSYSRTGGGPGAVVLLHGWPGDHTDFRLTAPLLVPTTDVVIPDLRGFGMSDKNADDPAQYSVDAQARSVVAIIKELGLVQPVLVGYDVGSRIAQAVVRSNPKLVGGLVISPPVPGIGQRILTAAAQKEFWYQAFHQLPLAAQLVDGQPEAVRHYLKHFWQHWSGPNFVVDAEHIDHLTSIYSPPGAFTASIAWYRAGAGSATVALAERPPATHDRVAVPTSVLWPESDPLFPLAWSDRLADFFSSARLHTVSGAGHFTPLECAERFATLINEAVTLVNDDSEDLAVTSSPS